MNDGRKWIVAMIILIAFVLLVSHFTNGGTVSDLRRLHLEFGQVQEEEPPKVELQQFSATPCGVGRVDFGGEGSLDLFIFKIGDSVFAVAEKYDSDGNMLVALGSWPAEVSPFACP